MLVLSPQCFLKDAYTFLVQAIPSVIIGRTNRTRRQTETFIEETQKQKLDPRIKNVWRVSDTIALTLIFLCVFAVGGIALLVDESTSWWAGPYCLISFICFVALLILFWVVITPLRYIRWSYALSKEFLDIMRGIIVRKHTVVPFIRVQNTDTRQGPLLRMMGLASVTISTAAGSMEIPGLPAAEAETLRDQAAEFARLAKEDV